MINSTATGHTAWTGDVFNSSFFQHHWLATYDNFMLITPRHSSCIFIGDPDRRINRHWRHCRNQLFFLDRRYMKPPIIDERDHYIYFHFCGSLAKLDQMLIHQPLQVIFELYAMFGIALANQTVIMPFFQQTSNLQFFKYFL